MNDHSLRAAGLRSRITFSACCGLAIMPSAPSGRAVSVQPALGSNVVIDWATIVQPAIHNALAPRPVPLAEILHTTIQLAVYDAVMASEGGYEPYVAAIVAPTGSDVRAAVATAAYRTARARVAVSQHAYLDAEYDAYMADIADGQAKTDGIQVGKDAGCESPHSACRRWLQQRRD
jgi:hypothetical protein